MGPIMMGKVPSALFVGYPRPGQGALGQGRVPQAKVLLESWVLLCFSISLDFLRLTPVYFSSTGTERGGSAGSRLPGQDGFLI